MQEGVITTFALIVEKVAPSVVTVFSTQTVARGLTTFPFSDDTLRQFFGGQVPQKQAGLREGDVIQEVNKQPVKSAKDLVATSKKLKANEKILPRVYSQGRSGYVALEAK